MPESNLDLKTFQFVPVYVIELAVFRVYLRKLFLLIIVISQVC